jgi:hypothetical protein
MRKMLSGGDPKYSSILDIFDITNNMLDTTNTRTATNKPDGGILQFGISYDFVRKTTYVYR